jgi:hypothetical protein
MHSNAQNHERNKIALQRKSLLINGPGHWREEEEEYYYRASPELSPMQKGADDNIQQNRIIKLRTAEEQPSNSRRWETTVLNLGRAGKGSKEESLKLHTKSRQTGSKIYIYVLSPKTGTACVENLRIQTLVTLKQNGSWSNLAPPKAPQKHHYETRTQNLPIANSDGFSSLSIESLSPFFSLSLCICILLGVLENKGGGGGVCVCCSK